MDKWLKAVLKYDPQIIVHFDPERQRHVILRKAERYGRPYLSYSHGEIKHAVSEAALSEIFVCQNDQGEPLTPGYWILDYLQKRDARRINFRDYVRDMDARNDRLAEQARMDTSDRLKYRLKEDFYYLRELGRGNTSVNPHTVAVKQN